MSDRLSARLVLDTSGNVVGRQAHLPFGEDFGESGTQEKHHFTSYERDAESGLDYAINRGYSLVLGRFQSADPYRAKGSKVDPQSWNRYRYSRNDPINLIDRLGLDEEEPNRLVCSNCTVNISGSNGAFSDLGGQMLIVLPTPGEQDPPVPGTVPVPQIPPPPPSVNTPEELVTYWAGMRDWVLSQGKCGQKLSSYVNGMNELMSSNNTLFIYDARQSDVANRTLPGSNPAETVQQYFNRTAESAVTSTTMNRRGRTTLAEIFLNPQFFTLGGTLQANLLVHEMLHATVNPTDADLARSLGVQVSAGTDPSKAISDWFANGCKNSGEQ